MSDLTTVMARMRDGSGWTLDVSLWADTPEGKALAALVEAALVNDGWAVKVGALRRCLCGRDEPEHTDDCPVRAYRQATEGEAMTPERSRRPVFDIRARHDDCAPDWCAYREAGGTRQTACDVPDLLAEIERLRQVQPYARHFDWCAHLGALGRPTGPCDCGFAALEGADHD